MAVKREHFHATGRFEWEKAIRKLPLKSSRKVVAYALATWADAETGGNAHPGEENLAEATGLTTRSVRDALGALRGMGLLFRESRGSTQGLRRLADVYILSLHNEARIDAGMKPCDCKSTGR